MPPPDARDHWPLHAAQWARIGPPLRPCADDVAIVEREVAAWAAVRGRAPRALLLGVTPELATMAWPAGTTLDAIDRSAAMVGAVFPTTGTPPAARARVGEWLALPHDAGGLDVVVGDGCLCCLPFPAGVAALASELGRVLAADGLAVLRLFAAPANAERLDDVAAAMWAGELASFHALKWRIAMAIQPPDRNVRVSDILAAFDAIAPDRAALADRTGWPLDTIGTIDAYRGSPAVYAFPTVAEQLEALAVTLASVTTHTPTYELGDRCPTIVLRPR